MKSESEGVYFSDEFIEIIEQLNCRSLVSENNVKEVIVELSKQELYQKPHLTAYCWKSLFYPLKAKFPNPNDLRSLHQLLNQQTRKWFLASLRHPTLKQRVNAYNTLNIYIRSLDTIMLKHVLCFLNGAIILPVEATNVTFKKNESKFTRRLIAHTCRSWLELPSTYSNSQQIFSLPFPMDVLCEDPIKVILK